MIEVHRRLGGSGLHARMLLQVHDELLFEVPEEELEPTQRLVREALGDAVALEVPLVVELGAGRSWYEAKCGQPAAEAPLHGFDFYERVDASPR